MSPSRSAPLPVAEPPAEAALPAVLTVDEAAVLLRVNRKSVYNAVARGDIPGARRLGRAIRLSRETVLRWLAEGQGRVSRSRRFR
jgi:excisionase family DNA binding protein